MEREQIQYQVIRSKRKTLSIQVRNGEVLVRCPYGLRERAIEDFVSSRQDWIKKHLQKQSQMKQLPAYTSDEILSLKKLAQEDISRRVAYFAPLVGVSYNRITIRHQKSRWGSCSNKGNLNFNCLLMLTPESVRDYVVVHELCHRKQMNHSPLFWTEVSRVLPDAKISRKWLRDHGQEILR